MNKPRDMLEFFRRTSPGEAEAPSPMRELEPTTRMLVVRRSQAVVAGVAAVAALVLAFVVGYAANRSGGSGGAAALPEVYVIRAASYGLDDRGRSSARKMKAELEKMNLGEEVQVLEVESNGRAVVAVGSWLSDPAGRKDARALRDKLRGVKDATQATPFADADFWRMER